jgi:hypothetical protein
MSYAPTPLSERFWRRVDKSGDCWLWRGGRANSGYGLAYSAENRKTTAHRIAYELGVGGIPRDGSYVCHGCDNKLCVRPSHLFLGTAKENMADMIAKGRGSWPGPKSPHRGERTPNARLTEIDVRWIRWAYAYSGASHAAIARVFGVATETVRKLLLRRTWGHV